MTLTCKVKKDLCLKEKYCSTLNVSNVVHKQHIFSTIDKWPINGKFNMYLSFILYFILL